MPTNLKYVRSVFTKEIAAGEPFTITHIFRNEGEAGEGGLELKVNEETISRAFSLGEGETYSLIEELTMPFDDLIRNYKGQVISKILLISPFWATVAHSLNVAFDTYFFPHGLGIVMCMLPKLRTGEITLEEAFRDCVFAHRAVLPAAGREAIEIWALGDYRTIIYHSSEYARSQGQAMTLEPEPVSKITDWLDFTIDILPCFPLAELQPPEFPEFTRPGEEFKVKLPVKNTGCRGDIGLRIRNLMTGEEISKTERLDHDSFLSLTFTQEMPPLPLVTMDAIPVYLGRHREWYSGEGTRINIKAMNTLLHTENVVKLYGGGYRELNTFIGFVAGKDVRVSGIGTTPGTGGPLGGIIPYGGYILSGELGPGDVATIEFDELYFLRIETTTGIATARLGNLIERDTKQYEYSVLPTPAMMFQPVNLLTTSMRKAAPRLEVRG